MKKILKWLPCIIVFIVIIIIMLVSLNKSNLPILSVKDKTSVDINEINKIIDMLKSDDTKGKASDKLEELYKNHSKDDIYYLTSAKIIMTNSNDVEAVGTLKNVKNKTPEYYNLMIRATSGEYFTYGQVPNSLLNTAIEAATSYSNNIDYQILLGELYYDKDNYTAAVYYLDKALQIDSSNVDANYYYALSIYLLGEDEIGLSYMEYAKELYKGDDIEFKKSIENYISLMKEGKR